MKKIRVFEAFAGIGAQRRALQNVMTNKYEIVGLADWYVPAIMVYETIHNGFSKKDINNSITREEMELYLSSKPLSWNSKNLVNTSFWKRKNLEQLRIIYSAIKKSELSKNIFDVRELYKRTLEGIDLLTYSFPCQDLSQQGVQKGMKKNSGTRSGLLWEIEKALENTKKIDLPKYLLMENVTALLNKNNKEELRDWINKLEQLGYKNSIGILNSGDFGSSQARKRVFMISSLGEKIDLPVGTQKPSELTKILQEDFDDIYFMPSLDKYKKTEFKLTKSNINKCALVGYSNFNSETYIYDPNFTGPTLTASGANSRIKIIVNKKIRRMTSLEAFRYMGFNDNDHAMIEKLKIITEVQKYHVCGNSISVEVLQEIIKKLKI